MSTVPTKVPKAPATLRADPAATAPIVVAPVMSTVPTKSVAPVTLKVLDKDVAPVMSTEPNKNRAASNTMELSATAPLIVVSPDVNSPN